MLLLTACAARGSGLYFLGLEDVKPYLQGKDLHSKLFASRQWKHLKTLTNEDALATFGIDHAADRNTLYAEIDEYRHGLEAASSGLLRMM